MPHPGGLPAPGNHFHKTVSCGIMSVSVVWYTYILVIVGCVINHYESITCSQKEDHWLKPTDTPTHLGVSKHLTAWEGFGRGRCVCHFSSDG